MYLYIESQIVIFDIITVVTESGMNDNSWNLDVSNFNSNWKSSFVSTADVSALDVKSSLSLCLSKLELAWDINLEEYKPAVAEVVSEEVVVTSVLLTG